MQVIMRRRVILRFFRVPHSIGTTYNIKNLISKLKDFTPTFDRIKLYVNSHDRFTGSRQKTRESEHVITPKNLDSTHT